MGISSSIINSRSKIYDNPFVKRSIFLLLEKASTKILIVEGDGDIPFYSKYINSSVLITEVTKLKDYNIPDPDYKDGYKTAKKYVQFIIDKHYKNVKTNTGINYGTCFGIVDKDFDGLNTKKYPNMGNKIICTDQRDLETTLIYFDRKNIETHFFSDFNKDGENFNVLQKSIEVAAQIGKLRLLREDKRKVLKGYLSSDILIDFKLKECQGERNGEDGYLLFFNNGVFNLKDFIGYKNKPDQINNILNDISNYSGDDLSFCRGHDIFNIITCYYKLNHQIKPEFLRNSCGLNKITSIRGNYEKLLKETFFNDATFISQSQIYKFLQTNQLT